MKFLQENTATSWLHPEHLKLSDYEIIEYIEKERSALIRAAAVKAKADQYDDGLNNATFEATLKRRLAMQTLLIQSISGPYSTEALKVLQDLAGQDSATQGPTTAQRYLDLALKFQDRSAPPPQNLDDIQALRKSAITSLDESEDQDHTQNSSLLELLPDGSDEESDSYGANESEEAQEKATQRKFLIWYSYQAESDAKNFIHNCLYKRIHEDNR